eukprot:UN31360
MVCMAKYNINGRISYILCVLMMKSLIYYYRSSYKKLSKEVATLENRMLTDHKDLLDDKSTNKVNVVYRSKTRFPSNEGEPLLVEFIDENDITKTITFLTSASILQKTCKLLSSVVKTQER